MRFHVILLSGANSALPSFDQALSQLVQLQRLFIEADGSFVWTGTATDYIACQVDGNLVDRGDALAYVELKGDCPTEQFDLLLRALGWPEVLLLFQLPRRGITLDEAE